MQSHYSTPLKRCIRCGKQFPVSPDFFHKHKGTRDGFRSDCKSCNNARRKQWTADNPERTKESNRRWREINSDYVREYNRKWHITNKDRKRKYNKQYREENIDRLRKYDRKRAKSDHRKQWRSNYRVEKPEVFARINRNHYRNNRDKYKVWAQNYEATKCNIPNDFAQDDWQYALEYFNGRCAICDRPPGFWHTLAMDHWVPISATDCPGTIPSNIVPLCHGIGGCNNSKHNNDPQEWLIKKFGTKKARAISKRIQRYFSLVRQTD